MGFETKATTERFKIPNIEAGPHVFFGDVLGIERADLRSPLVGSWFRIEKGPGATPPAYEYNECGVVFEGSLTLRDESGKVEELIAGDSFFIHQGSKITFSSENYALCFKCGTRRMNKL